ncbi:PAS domain-containing sensor histidine kinase [Polaromonas sp. P1-6]|nr:PAS domain-containing sensor histidine kinase [Polaromonas sp. P1-6]
MSQNLKAVLRPNISRFALGIGLLYAALGVLWILASDTFVTSISDNPAWMVTAQRYKGVFYVLSTSLGLIFLVNAGYRRVFDALNRAEAMELHARDLFLQHPKPMWVYDQETLAFLAVNEAATRYYGYSREEFLQMHLSDLRPAEDLPLLLAHRLDAVEGHHDMGVVRHRKKSSELVFVHLTLHTVQFLQRKAAMVMAIDVTAAKEHEAQRAANQFELERLVAERTAELVRVNAELDAFARTVAHDLKSPLVSVVGFTQILQKRYAAVLSEDGAKLTARIERSAKQMASLVNNLLSLSRVSTTVLNIGDVDLVPVAQDIMEELQEQEPHRKVRFEAPASLHVRADAGLVRPLLANLLGNAWKFTGKRDDAHVQLLVDAEAAEVIVRVQDNGVGFDARNTELLFKPFQRFHTLSEFSGTGIGLTTCQRIIARHHGRIWVESTPGEGTSVFVTFAPALKQGSVG